MRSRVYETVEGPSVCSSHRSTAAAAVAGGFVAERRAGGRYRSTAAGAGAVYQLQARSAATALQHHGAQQRMRAVRRWQLRYEAEHRLAIVANLGSLFVFVSIKFYILYVLLQIRKCTGVLVATSLRSRWRFWMEPDAQRCIQRILPSLLE